MSEIDDLGTAVSRLHVRLDEAQATLAASQERVAELEGALEQIAYHETGDYGEVADNMIRLAREALGLSCSCSSRGSDGPSEDCAIHGGEHGPFDAEELVQWAELYGHPETWVKTAQNAHAKMEVAQATLAASQERVAELEGALTQCMNTDDAYVYNLASAALAAPPAPESDPDRSERLTKEEAEHLNRPDATWRGGGTMSRRRNRPAPESDPTAPASTEEGEDGKS